MAGLAKKTTIALAMGMIVFLSLACYFFIQVTRFQSEVELLTVQISSMSNQIVNLQTQIEEKDSHIEKVGMEYQEIQSKHGELLIEYRNLSEEYEGLQTEYEIIYDVRYDEGYNDGYVQGLEEMGYTVIDPTYDEALQFIGSDGTDKKRYVAGKYECWNFAADFKNNAFNVGYRCGWVYVELRESAHAIVCFNTTDSGLIFVEPQDDELVTLTIGQPYFDREKYEVTFDDTIVRIVIIW